MLSTPGSYSAYSCLQACLYVTSLGLNNFTICLLACFHHLICSSAMCVKVQHYNFCVCHL